MLKIFVRHCQSQNKGNAHETHNSDRDDEFRRVAPSGRADIVSDPEREQEDGIVEHTACESQE